MGIDRSSHCLKQCETPTVSSEPSGISTYIYIYICFFPSRSPPWTAYVCYVYVMHCNVMARTRLRQTSADIEIARFDPDQRNSISGRMGPFHGPNSFLGSRLPCRFNAVMYLSFGRFAWVLPIKTPLVFTSIQTIKQVLEMSNTSYCMVQVSLTGPAFTGGSQFSCCGNSAAECAILRVKCLGFRLTFWIRSQTLPLYRGSKPQFLVQQSGTSH